MKRYSSFMQLRLILTFFYLLILLGSIQAQPAKTSPADSSEFQIAAADTTFQSAFLWEIFFGKYYRDVWSQPVKAPVINFKEQAGGVTPYELGGGQQTKSLRLYGPDSNTFVLRSIKKYPAKAIPESLRFPLTIHFVKDQVSSSMPYGAFTLPPMADAAGVFHTNPQYFYVPNSEILGIYNDTFAHTLAMFEERPEDFFTLVKSVGYAPKAIDSDEVMEAKMESMHHLPDQRQYLRSRLFDMIIGDWDRHEGQWNWGIVEKDSQIIYRPIPVDRDNVYYNFDGVLPYFFSRSWAIPKFQKFEKHIQDIEGFNYNARYVDRYFLNELTYQDWMEISDSLSRQLTQEAISRGLSKLPDEIELKMKPYLEKRIVQRKNDIAKYAEDYYAFLSKNVNIPGSNGTELFSVQRVNNSSTLIKVFELKNEDTILRYSRIFHTDETEEIRLYGRGGNDQFYITGNSQKNIKIIITPGQGKDIVQEKSNVKGMKSKTVIYSFPNQDTILNYGEATVIESSDTFLSDYDYKRYKYDYSGPMINSGYNFYEKFHFELGWQMINYSYDNRHYQNKHQFYLRAAPDIHNYSLHWNSHWKAAHDGTMEKRLTLNILPPEYQMPFHGLSFEDINDPYNIRFSVSLFRIDGLFILYPFRKGPFSAGIQLATKYTQIDFPKSNFFSHTMGLKKYKTHAYIIPGMTAGIKTTTGQLFPTKGVEADVTYSYHFPIMESPEANSLSGKLKFFLPLLKENLVLAYRGGGTYTSTLLPFPEMPLLGSEKNIRGYSPNRFAGRSILYQNVEVRWRLNQTIGILSFYDLGKTFLPNKTTKWHYGYGGGVFLTFFDKLLFTVTYGRSTTEHSLQTGFGLFF